MDVCVVLYHSDAERIRSALRPCDALLIQDNTTDNIGFAAGANRAAATGSGDILLFVNTDGDLIGDCLDKVEAVFANPEVVAASPSIGVVWDPPLRADGAPEFLSGACLAVRRSSFEQVGGFDETLFMYGEDVDLSWKLEDVGRTVRVSDALYLHDTEKHRPFRSERRWARNRIIVRKRHGRPVSISRMTRDGVFDLRCRRWSRGIGIFVGVADYWLRGWRWV